MCTPTHVYTHVCAMHVRTCIAHMYVHMCVYVCVHSCVHKYTCARSIIAKHTLASYVFFFFFLVTQLLLSSSTNDVARAYICEALTYLWAQRCEHARVSCGERALRHVCLEAPFYFYFSQFCVHSCSYSLSTGLCAWVQFTRDAWHLRPC